MTTSQPVSTPMDEDYAVCAACGTELEAVRPGKHQHPGDTRRLCDLLQTRARSLREAVELLAARDKTIEALREDAERYRWLRDQQYNDDVDLRFADYNEDGPTDTWYSLWGAELDAAIDAARSEGGEP